MNVSEGSFQYALTRPEDIDFNTASYIEIVENNAAYLRWLRTAEDLLSYEEYAALLAKEAARYSKTKEYNKSRRNTTTSLL